MSSGVLITPEPTEGVLAIRDALSRLGIRAVLRADAPPGGVFAYTLTDTAALKAAEARIAALEAENAALKSKLDGIKSVGRATALLSRYLGATENEARKYLERRAMDMRITLSDAAAEIIRTYERL